MDIVYRNDGRAFQEIQDLGYELEGDLSEVITSLQNLLTKYSQPTECSARYTSNKADRFYPSLKEVSSKCVSFDRIYLEKEYYGEDSGIIRLCGERSQLPEEISALAEIKADEDEEKKRVRLIQFNKLKEEFGDV